MWSCQIGSVRGSSPGGTQNCVHVEGSCTKATRPHESSCHHLAEVQRSSLSYTFPLKFTARRAFSRHCSMRCLHAELSETEEGPGKVCRRSNFSAAVASQYHGGTVVPHSTCHSAHSSQTDSQSAKAQSQWATRRRATSHTTSSSDVEHPRFGSRQCNQCTPDRACFARCAHMRDT